MQEPPHDPGIGQEFAVPGFASGRFLYRPEDERDACGVGFVADITGERSHRVLQTALHCVENLTHRGAVDADAKTGDGAGVQTQLPYKLLRKALAGSEQEIGEDDDLAVGMVFLPHQTEAANECRSIIDDCIGEEGLTVLSWRSVPVDVGALGRIAAESQPTIMQVLICRPAGLDDINYARRLYLARRRAERRARDAGQRNMYIASMSNRTVVYKGLMVAHQLPEFYLDLREPAYETALCVFHQRYSTNTLPNWVLAQPFRVLSHNGEINTLQGNRNWTRAREAELESSVWGDRVDDLKPVLQPDMSDSASLDNAVEAIMLSGRDVRHAMMMLVPEAWENMPNMQKSHRDFFEYHACLTEPWDGPASLAFTDGVIVGASLDRNGLRPARYQLTNDNLVIMGSEAGMVEVDPKSVIEKGRLGPGQMICVDTARREMLRNDEIKDRISAQQPYGSWVKRQLLHLDDYLGSHPNGRRPDDVNELIRQQVVFGFTAEELQFVIRPMGGEGHEPTWSMGDDTALSVLAGAPRSVASFFKQKFAQVTNPPIDPIREEMVMSLDTYLGRRRSLFEESEAHARLLHLNSPLMTDEEMEQLRRIGEPAFHAITVSVLIDPALGPDGMDAGLERVCRSVEQAIDDGATIIILSDRGVSAERAPIPMLLAVGAVHHHLIKTGRRMKASIIAETGFARDVHQIATLIGFGASAVNPFLVFATLREMVIGGRLKDVDLTKALEGYEASIDSGILKIMSKMGISAVSGYHAAQIFEAIGLGQELVDRCFWGTSSRIGGVGLEELAREALDRHATAYGAVTPKLEEGGYYRYRRDGEYHAWNPEIIKAFHRARDNGTYADYKAYSDLVQNRPSVALRDLLDFCSDRSPISLDQVEPVEAILPKFATSAMSLGALSPEAHETMSIGMNRIGGKSNTGEGGEDPRRFTPMPNGDSSNSKIKQVASARFGVTPGYLASAEQLEIKMAQGSKPGEGGQLPAHKVSAQIAALRHTLPGTPLISPPPHHDIYSIEDLAQLIYDLKQVNPRATVTVKLVAEEGIGTIAAGVAKAYADNIHISGHDGGTGASPMSSIKYAGSPWEMGLSEVQQVLVLNDLRGRVLLRTDGGMKTGRDVIVAAMLGAEEYGFGTAAAVAVGCTMARQCHLNTCPTGVATQREDLRAKFTGTPEQVVTFFTLLAEEVRELLAALGYESLHELVGRRDLLKQVMVGEDPRTRLLDLSKILADPDPAQKLPRKRQQPRNDRPEEMPLDHRIIADAASALDKCSPVKLQYKLRNVNRTVGAGLAGEIAHRYGDAGLEPGTIDIAFEGSAGQSFGAFCIRGMRLDLTGEANDYVGKGMGGGELIVRPPAGVRYRSHNNTIVGNTVLYGATGGTFFAAGRAGERFAVRNSGAKAVVEGVGDHGCEYMTEGVVVILGETGRNFGAGMSNGVAYVLDESRDLPKKLNPELVGMQQVTADADIVLLQTMVSRHLDATGSRRAKEILDRWDSYLPLFWKVAPHFALTEEGPMTVVHRHLESIKAGAA
jgi:glutamate synthase (NADPH/NADH) large chain/glutamate synthase (ferredoxin)